jgi:hypothetical protein
LSIAGVVVLGAGLLAGLNGFRTSSAVDAARRQNRALKAQQEVLREQAFELAGRLFEDIERGHRLARLAGIQGRAWDGPTPPPPPRDAGSEVLLAWLSEEGARLEALENELAASRFQIGGKQPFVRAPVADSAALLRVTDTSSARR